MISSRRFNELRERSEVTRVKKARDVYRNEMFSCFCKIMKELIVEESEDFDKLRLRISTGQEYNDEGYDNSFDSVVLYSEEDGGFEEEKKRYREDDIRNIVREAAIDANYVLREAFLNEVSSWAVIEFDRGVISIRDTEKDIHWEYKEE